MAGFDTLLSGNGFNLLLMVSCRLMLNGKLDDRSKAVVSSR
jgi:hypothetical protein